MVVDVVRFGSLASFCSVDYATQDLETGAASAYVPVAGKLTFQPGELFKEIRIPIIRSPSWQPIIEFQLLLSDPFNCELTQYLCSTRVKLIDNNYFPTNEANLFSCSLKGDATDLRLVVEFSKWIYSFTGVASKTWTTLLVDQLSNSYLLLTTYLLKYVTDEVLAPASMDTASLLVPGNVDLTLLTLAALYILPFALLYFANRHKAEMRLEEDARAALQDMIFARTLNLAAATRHKISNGEMTLLISKDADEAVKGYTKALALVKEVGKLLVSAAFILAENKDAILLLMFFGVAVLLYLQVRYNETVRLTEAMSTREASVVDSVQNTYSNWHTIRDYFVRPQQRESMLEKLQRQADASLPLSLRRLNAAFFPAGLSAVLLALYIPFGGRAVLNDSIGIGSFLATLNILQAAGESFSAILSGLLDITSAIAPMSAITEVMNMKLMPLEMKPVNRRRRATTKQERVWSESENLFGSDLIAIQLKNVGFRYIRCERDIFRNVSLSIPQGSLVALVGPPHEGKSTLLKLLGQVLQPTVGEVFMPSYLRVLHVSRHFSSLLEGGLWQNLVTGSEVYWRDRASEAERVIRVCRRLGFRQQLMDILEEGKSAFLRNDKSPESATSCDQELSLTDRVLINLARALIYDPNIMVLNRPTVQLSPVLAERVGKILREFVDQRGFEIHGDPRTRRPRTVFASYLRKEDADLVDVWWKVAGGRVTELNNVQARDLHPDTYCWMQRK